MQPNREKVDPKRCEWIRNYFEGEEVFIVGGGPSLHGFDFSRLEGKRTIAINHSYRYFNPEVLVFLDSRFRKEVEQQFNHDLYSMPFKIVAGPSSGMRNRDNCTVIQIAHQPTENPAAMYGRAQTGLVAINMSLIGNAKNIYLMGFDFKFSKDLGHFYSKDWKHSQDENEQCYVRMKKHYEKYGEYKNIYNCNLESGLHCFEKISIEDVI